MPVRIASGPYFFSPASIRTGSLFSGGGSGQVAYGVKAQGGLYALLKSSIDGAVLRHRRVEEAARAVGLLGAGLVPEDVEQFLGVRGFEDRDGARYSLPCSWNTAYAGALYRLR